MKSDNVNAVFELLHGKDFKGILEILKTELKNLSHEEKLDVLSNVLCEEWHLIKHQEFIKEVLDVFAETFK